MIDTDSMHLSTKNNGTNQKYSLGYLNNHFIEITDGCVSRCVKYNVTKLNDPTQEVQK
jgi:hypothetical protein